MPPGAGHLLVAGGAHVTIDHATVAGRPTREPPAPTSRALQLDDVIDFHDLLTGDTWFDQIVKSLCSPDGHSA